MKVAVALAFLAAVANAGSFSAEDQAIWLDRHNYFRTTGLPWAAGDMRRIGWSSDLATSAASTAAQCSAASAVGVNVFQSSTANSSSIIDEAVQQWVVETSMTTLKTLPQPGAVGVPVGTGVYNAYSQVLWASTTSVGCATASCSGGDLVVCEYAPAGNDASSPWYVHAETASACPSGTTASQGLCVVEGDAANDQIAAIPAGKLTYEVYAGYVANMQTLLIEAARAIASGSTTQTAAPTDSATQTAPAATTATTAAPTTSYSQASSSSTSADGSATKTGATKTTTGSAYSSLESGSGSEASTATKNGKTASSSTTDSSSSSSDASKATKTAKTASSSTTDSSSETSMATKSGKTTTSSSTTDASDATTQTSQTSQSSSTSSSDESAPGTVKASSDTGSTFTNQTPSTTTESSTEQSSTTPSAEQTSGSATTAPSTASAESASTITNKSSTSSGGGISAAGMAGMIVLAVVGVAAFGVVMSYKRNQQRQREIMRDGGIRII